MNAITILLLGLSVSVIAVVLGQFKSEYALLCTICGSILVFAFALEQVEQILGFVKSLQQKTNISAEYISIIFKVIGICIFGEFSIAVCTDNRHSALASGMSFLCRVAIIVLALPIFKDVLKALEELLR